MMRLVVVEKHFIAEIIWLWSKKQYKKLSLLLADEILREEKIALKIILSLL
jgi:hypothetical protein